MKGKNIVLFIAESWDGRKLGLTGHPALRDATPNIDRLAANGACFERAHTSHPICCPARANLWSGRYSHQIESWNNFKGLQPGMWTLFDTVKTTHTIKSLGKLDYLSGGHSIFARVGAWLAPVGLPRTTHGHLPDIQDPVVTPDRERRCHEKDWRILDKARAFIREQAKGEAPFFLNISTGLVHPGFRTNQYWLDKIPAEAVDLPPPDPTDHPVRRYQRMSKGWQHTDDPERTRLLRRIYYAMCAEADALVGELQTTLREAGLLENTYFIFASDHGELAGDHGEWQKHSMYDASLRIPLIINGPGIPAGRRVDNITSLIDLHPTLLAMAGHEPRPGTVGESLLPLASGRTEVSRNHAYACFTGITMNTSAFMLRRDRWKYVVYPGFPAQLFDMEQDPDELHDCAADQPAIVAQLDSELRKIVDIEETHEKLVAYDKAAFREWRRQAKLGCYRDDTYSLAKQPSSDYWDIMRNIFENYDKSDEVRVNTWLNAP